MSELAMLTIAPQHDKYGRCEQYDDGQSRVETEKPALAHRGRPSLGETDENQEGE